MPLYVKLYVNKYLIAISSLLLAFTGVSCGVHGDSVADSGPIATSISIVQDIVTLTQGQTFQFSANIEPSTATAVWSVEEGSDNGTISLTEGSYTPPASISEPKLVTIQALNSTDPNSKDTAKVFLTPSGNLPLTGDTFSRPIHVRLMNDGKTALISDMISAGGLYRVDLLTHITDKISAESLTLPDGFSIDKTDSYAYIIEHKSTPLGRVLRVDISTGTIQPMTDAVFIGASDLLLEEGGESALVVEYLNSRISRVKLKDCAPSCEVTKIADVTTPNKITFWPGHDAAIINNIPVNSSTGNLYILKNISTCSICSPSLVISGLSKPEGIAINQAGTKAYVVETTLNRVTEIRLSEDLPLPGMDGTEIGFITTDLNRPEGIALEPGEKNLLVTESPGGGVPGRVKRIPIP